MSSIFFTLVCLTIVGKTSTVAGVVRLLRVEVDLPAFFVDDLVRLYQQQTKKHLQWLLNLTLH